MRRMGSTEGVFGASRILMAGILGIALAAAAAPQARAQKNSDARGQFERAVEMRTMLEGYLERDRTVSDYKRTIAAYQKVYLISPQSEDVTAALVAEAELYQEMGRLYGPQYFQSSIDTYRFLLKQYPGSRYCGEALLTIAQIQKDNLNEPDNAAATAQEYLTRFPHSEKSAEARAMLREAASVQQKAPSALPELQGQKVSPRATDGPAANVTGIQSWNTPDATRILVTVSNTIQYRSAHIASPDRIYFDLYKAQLSAKLAAKSISMHGGLVQVMRLAQNKQGVVRLVLDVKDEGGYSAYLLSNPYRLVIEMSAQSSGHVSSAPEVATAAPEDSSQVSAKTLARSESDGGMSPGIVASGSRNKLKASSKQAAGISDAPAVARGKHGASAAIVAQPLPEARPTRDGQQSLTRILGLKINRIVIDPGHGGHDTGTIGPHGLMEKDLCLDVALRLGRLIRQKLPGAEVIYTRKDDTFVPLEERTAIANRAKADLFISIHANSSHDSTARGIETYYLNFSASPESMEVAARENAESQESLHDLQDLIRKIARNDKIAESKELAEDIQDTLSQRLQVVSRSERNRGVKRAPFVVLIGANMPSVLSEISFVSNPNDERLLRRPEQRQRIADGLYRGISDYLRSLNSLSYDQRRLISDNHYPPNGLEPTAAVAPRGNSK